MEILDGHEGEVVQEVVADASERHRGWVQFVDSRPEFDGGVGRHNPKSAVATFSFSHLTIWLQWRTAQRWLVTGGRIPWEVDLPKGHPQ